MWAFLSGVLGMFVGGLLLLVVAWFVLKFLIRRWIRKLVDALSQGGAPVPPFRVTLERDDELEWADPKTADAASAALEELGYERIADYRSDEMPGVCLRALVHTGVGVYAVVYEHPQAGVIADVVCDFADGDHITFSSAPPTGLDRAEWSRMTLVSMDLKDAPSSVVQLHESIVGAVAGREIVAVSADGFVRTFTTAYARDMDWRIERGGLTAEEVRRSAEVNGLDPPTDEAVQAVRDNWRAAISAFVDEQLRERFLKHVTKMSAAQWEDVRDRLYIVHEHSMAVSVIEHLAEALADVEPTDSQAIGATQDGPRIERDGAAEVGDEDDDDDAWDQRLEAARSRLTPLFDRATVREAFFEAQQMLPSDRRFRRLAGVKSPYRADVYAAPKEAST